MDIYLSFYLIIRSISTLEIERAFHLLQNVLFNFKKEGWTRGIPVIWINGVELVEVILPYRYRYRYIYISR